MSHRRNAILLSLVSLAAVFLLAELALRALVPVPDPYERQARLKPQINQYIRMEYPKNYVAVTEAETGLPGLSGVNHFSTNNYGFRGDSLAVPKPANEYRVFIVGGSTAECFYLDDEDEVGRVMQRELAGRVPAGKTPRVYNAGFSGAASDDHVAMVSQRLVHLEPDLIVVMSGINDLTRSIFNYDYLHYVEYRPAYQKPWHKRLLTSSQIGRRLYYLTGQGEADPNALQEERPLKTNYAGLIGLQKTVPPTDVEPRTDEPSYERNLRSLAGIARANRVPLILVTQQTTWNSDVDPGTRKWQWMRYRDGVTYAEEPMDLALERLNVVMRRVGESEGVPVLDLSATLPKATRYFYDDCHFTVEGAAEVGRRLATLVGDMHAPREDAAHE